MSKLRDLIPNIFSKLLNKNANKSDEAEDTEEDDIDEIADMVKDNFTALKLYRLDALDFAFDIIEGESNAKFAFEHKSYDNNKSWISVSNQAVSGIKDVVNKMYEVENRPDGDDDEEEYFVDYSQIAEHFIYLLDKNLIGDEVVNYRRNRIAEIYFNGKTDMIERLEKLCDECYIRQLDSKMDTVFWVENEINDNKLTEMKNILDKMAEQSIKQYGRDRNNIIPFPGVEQENVKSAN